MQQFFSLLSSRLFARLLRSWVRIPQEARIFVCCECRVLLGRGLCDELITRPEESYRLCCVVVCDLETSRIGAPYIYIYDIRSLRVNALWNVQLPYLKYIKQLSNPKIIMAPWSPPLWMTEGRNGTAGFTRLKNEYYQVYAEYFVK